MDSNFNEINDLKNYYNNLNFLTRLLLMPSRYGRKLDDNISPVDAFHLATTKQFQRFASTDFKSRFASSLFSQVCVQLQEKNALTDANLCTAMESDSPVTSAIIINILNEAGLLNSQHIQNNLELLIKNATATELENNKRFLMDMQEKKLLPMSEITSVLDPRKQSAQTLVANTLIKLYTSNRLNKENQADLIVHQNIQSLAQAIVDLEKMGLLESLEMVHCNLKNLIALSAPHQLTYILQSLQRKREDKHPQMYALGEQMKRNDLILLYPSSADKHELLTIRDVTQQNFDKLTEYCSIILTRNLCEQLFDGEMLDQTEWDDIVDYCEVSQGRKPVNRFRRQAPREVYGSDKDKGNSFRKNVNLYKSYVAALKMQVECDEERIQENLGFQANEPVAPKDLIHARSRFYTTPKISPEHNDDYKSSIGCGI